ncbi:hypothetical protein F0562_006882 [Nyssa sinensis]|uniref:Uncharacterized protein n=1 Tax=Nyssa sinensis TaxID=561372 RepID=A0A5J5AQB2_9ASTE|nr:hypothetical protein F0562_006882 [Nyssa sinensis]
MPCISQFSSLQKFLDSLGADIIWFQVIKLSKRELTVDLVITDGHGCLLSCTRSSNEDGPATPLSILSKIHLRVDKGFSDRVEPH